MEIKELAELFDAAYPFSGALSYDNVGLLVGRLEKKVNTVLVSLDLTHGVIEEARSLGADLIISHHPVIFREIKRITDESYVGGLLLSLIESGIAAIALHTNFDRAEDGGNFALARALGAKEFSVIDDGFATEFPLSSEEDIGKLARRAAEALGEVAVRTIGEGTVRSVIASCGAGISEGLILRAKDIGAAIVTADVKHNYASMAKDLGVRVVELTHFGSEWGFTAEIKKFLAEKAAGVRCFVSRHNTNPYG